MTDCLAALIASSSFKSNNEQKVIPRLYMSRRRGKKTRRFFSFLQIAQPKQQPLEPSTLHHARTLSLYHPLLFFTYARRVVVVVPPKSPKGAMLLRTSYRYSIFSFLLHTQQAAADWNSRERECDALLLRVLLFCFFTFLLFFYPAIHFCSSLLHDDEKKRRKYERIRPADRSKKRYYTRYTDNITRIGLCIEYIHTSYVVVQCIN